VDTAERVRWDDSGRPALADELARYRDGPDGAGRGRTGPGGELGARRSERRHKTRARKNEYWAGMESRYVCRYRLGASGVRDGPRTYTRIPAARTHMPMCRLDARAIERLSALGPSLSLALFCPRHASRDSCPFLPRHCSRLPFLIEAAPAFPAPTFHPTFLPESLAVLKGRRSFARLFTRFTASDRLLGPAKRRPFPP
jgi:hypothetical protein